MGIFGNDYDAGYRAGHGFGGQRGRPGDRQAWGHPRGENRLMDGVDRHYDRDYTFQSGRYGAYTGRGGYGAQSGYDREMGGYDRDVKGHGAPAMWNTWENVLDDNMGAGGGYGARGYDRGYRGGMTGGGRGGYDRGYGRGMRGGYDRGYQSGPRNADLRSDVGYRREEPRGMLERWARGWGFGVQQDDRGGWR